MLKELNEIKNTGVAKQRRRVTIDRNNDIDVMIEKLTKYIDNDNVSDKYILQIFLDNSVKLLSVDINDFKKVRDEFNNSIIEIRKTLETVKEENQVDVKLEDKDSNNLIKPQNVLNSNINHKAIALDDDL